MINKIWFFDIDDTLIDTAGTNHQASLGISQVIENNFNQKIANKITDSFNQIFNLMLSGYRVKEERDWEFVLGGRQAFDQLVTRIESCQKQVIKEYKTAKKWSREVFIKLAADNHNIQISPEIVHQAADSYWMTLTEKTIIFPGAKKLFEYLHKTTQPVFLVTSSDARLKMDNQDQFIYDPIYSESLKRERIELLRSKGINFRLVSIGDPEDKPSIEFFQKAITLAEENLDKKIDSKNCVMVGDSYGGDLEVPHRKLNFGLVVLFVKSQQLLKVEDNQYISTGDLFNLSSY